MHFEIHLGHSLNIKDSFKDYIKDSIESIIHTYVPEVADDELNINVDISAGKNSSHCHIAIHGGHHIMFRSDSNVTGNPSMAFDLALCKITNNLKKYKSKFTEYRKGASKAVVRNVKKVIADYNKFSSDNDSLDQDDAVLFSQDAAIETLTSVEAVMKMDLGNFGGLSYIDAETENISFVYRRPDGNLAFIDTGKKF